jgi:hypothetical protein
MAIPKTVVDEFEVEPADLEFREFSTRENKLARFAFESGRVVCALSTGTSSSPCLRSLPTGISRKPVDLGG